MREGGERECVCRICLKEEKEGNKGEGYVGKYREVIRGLKRG